MSSKQQQYCINPKDKHPLSLYKKKLYVNTTYGLKHIQYECMCPNLFWICTDENCPFSISIKEHVKIKHWNDCFEWLKIK